MSPSFSGLIAEWGSPLRPAIPRGKEQYQNACTSAGSVCRVLRSGVGAALPDYVCTISTIWNVQTQLECRQHGASNTIIATQELSGALHKGNGWVNFPFLHSLNFEKQTNKQTKQLYGRLTITLLKSQAATWVSLGSLFQEADQS